MPNNEETPSAACSSSAPPWIELPVDVTANILHRLDAIEILESAQKVCTTWRRVCQDPAMWQVIQIRKLNGLSENRDLNILCCHAVDRSLGQVTDILLEYFGDDQLMNYISERSSHLRRLTLANCYDISGKCLGEAVKKFLQLEELCLIMMPSIHPSDIETIGVSCPMLQSFTLVKLGVGCRYTFIRGSADDGFMYGVNYNAYALAVAKSMPNLHQLRLFADDMKNEGLQALLDGCPHLESQCFGVDLRGVLGERCSQQIKHLRCPSDSIDDCNWNACASCKGGNYSPDYSDLDCFEPNEDYTSGYFSDEETWLFDCDYI